MSLYPIFEAVLITALICWSLQKTWRTLVPAIRTALRRDSGKACGSACSGCESGSPPVVRKP